jgi:hypothetical protein
MRFKIGLKLNLKKGFKVVFKVRILLILFLVSLGWGANPVSLVKYKFISVTKLLNYIGSPECDTSNFDQFSAKSVSCSVFFFYGSVK